MLDIRTGNLIVVRQSRLPAPLIDQTRAIYVESFPPSQRGDFEDLIAHVMSQSRWLFTAMVSDTLLGFAVGTALPGSDVHVLEYMAVGSAFRNQGVGAELLRVVARTVRAAGNVSGILLEVESDDVGDEDEKRLRKRRIQFYSRNGARLLECAPLYRTPNLAGQGFLDMKLMWMPFDETQSALSGNKLRDCICKIYSHCYGRPANDPLVQTTLRHLLS